MGEMPIIDQMKCDGCGLCVTVCACGALVSLLRDAVPQTPWSICDQKEARGGFALLSGLKYSGVNCPQGKRGSAPFLM